MQVTGRSAERPARPGGAGGVRCRRAVSALPLLCCAALGGCSGEPAPASAPAVELTAGPLRWLMLPEESQQARRLRTSHEAVDFLAAFWRRRNPNPESPANDCARLFHERVEAADRLYDEGATRGSLTDRGRALILMGPPPVMRYGQRRIPSWETGHPSSQPAVHTRLVAVETWIYPFAALAPALQTLLESDASFPAGQPTTMVFLADSPRHTRLLEGDRLLELAARSLVRDLPAVEPRRLQVARPPSPPLF